MSDFQTEQGAAAFWRNVDSRIERKVNERFKAQSGITPNTAYSSVMFDAAGRAVWGGAGGGSSPFLLRYRTGSSGTGSIASNTEARLDFHAIDQDDNSYVTIGASWKFEPPSDGWYAITFFIRWTPSGGDISAGGHFDMTWWRSSVQEDTIYEWTADGTVPSGTTNTIAFRAVLFFQASYDVNFRLDNDIGQTLNIATDAYIAIERIGDPTP